MKTEPAGWQALFFWCSDWLKVISEKCRVISEELRLQPQGRERILISFYGQRGVSPHHNKREELYMKSMKAIRRLGLAVLAVCILFLVQAGCAEEARHSVTLPKEARELKDYREQTLTAIPLW